MTVIGIIHHGQVVSPELFRYCRCAWLSFAPRFPKVLVEVLRSTGTVKCKTELPTWIWAMIDRLWDSHYGHIITFPWMRKQHTSIIL